MWQYSVLLFCSVLVSTSSCGKYSAATKIYIYFLTCAHSFWNYKMNTPSNYVTNKNLLPNTLLFSRSQEATWVRGGTSWINDKQIWLPLFLMHGLDDSDSRWSCVCLSKHFVVTVTYLLRVHSHKHTHTPVRNLGFSVLLNDSSAGDRTIYSTALYIDVFMTFRVLLWI